MNQTIFNITDFHKYTELLGHRVRLKGLSNCLVDMFVKGDIPQQTK
jgi:hypothetical protein